MSLDVAGVLECITDAFIALDRRGTIIYVNRQSERLFRQPREQLIGRNLWNEVLEFRDIADTKFYTEFERVLRESVPVEYEQYFAPSGRWIEARGYPVTDGVVAYLRDITRRKQAEAERAELLAREQSARAAAEAAIQSGYEFLATISQDIRNPLAAIRGSNHVIKRRLRAMAGPDKDQAVERLAAVDATVDSLATRLDELLDIARMRMGRPLELERSPTDLVALLNDLVIAHGAALPDRHLEFYSRSPQLVGLWDATRLRAAFACVLDSAVEVCPADKVIQLTAEEKHDGIAWAEVGIFEPGGALANRVGSPVPEHYYRRSAPARRSTVVGVGLASARRIIEQHGGSLEPAPKNGVTIRLPLFERRRSPIGQGSSRQNGHV